MQISIILVFVLAAVESLNLVNGWKCRDENYMFHEGCKPLDRVKASKVSPKFCDDVAQSSGIINTPLRTQSFFWYFESRHQPRRDPLIVYINGAMGSSSILGLNSGMFPCHVNNYGNGTWLNPYSWNNFANLLILDPIGIGFAPKELEEEHNVKLQATSLVNAIFLFLRAHPNLRNIPIHLASESYSAAIVLKTSQLIVHINMNGARKLLLKSAIVGSAMIDAYFQYPFLTLLASRFGIRLKSPKQCQDAILDCRNEENSCEAAIETCVTNLVYPYYSAGFNIYQLPGFKPLRSKSMDLSNLIFLTETFLNQDVVKNELGIPPYYSFNYFNPSIFTKAAKSREYIKNHSITITELKNNGIKILYYGGDMDYLCNPTGYVSALEDHKARLLKSILNGAEMGFIIHTNNLTAVKFTNASHYVRLDQPQFLSEVIMRWINELLI